MNLQARDYAVLQDIRVDTLSIGGCVSVELNAVVENLHPWKGRTCALVLEIHPPDDSPVIRQEYQINVLSNGMLEAESSPISVPSYRDPHHWVYAAAFILKTMGTRLYLIIGSIFFLTFQYR